MGTRGPSWREDLKEHGSNLGSSNMARPGGEMEKKEERSRRGGRKSRKRGFRRKAASRVQFNFDRTNMKSLLGGRTVPCRDHFTAVEGEPDQSKRGQVGE